MKQLALITSAALAVSAFATPMAAAETYSECIDRVQDDCALFVPRNSANWAACVETFIEIECAGLPGSLTDDPADLWAKLD